MTEKRLQNTLLAGEDELQHGLRWQKLEDGVFAAHFQDTLIVLGNGDQPRQLGNRASGFNFNNSRYPVQFFDATLANRVLNVPGKDVARIDGPRTSETLPAHYTLMQAISNIMIALHGTDWIPLPEGQYRVHDA